jgi:hypothetical protein
MLDEIINYVQSLQRQVEVLLSISAHVNGCFWVYVCHLLEYYPVL